MKYLSTLLLTAGVAIGAGLVMLAPLVHHQHESVVQNTSGMVVITHDQEPLLFVLISEHGRAVTVSMDHCKEDEECVKLVSRLYDEKKFIVAEVGSEDEDGGEQNHVVPKAPDTSI